MDNPDPGNLRNILLQLLLLAALTGVNAFFASAEIALVSVNKNKLRLLAEEGNKKARRLLTLGENPNKFLSTIQVAITLSGFFASASAATGLSAVVGNWLTGLGLPSGQTVAFFAITLLLSYLTLVFGELYPKRLALRNPERTAMRSLGLLNAASVLFTPFVKVLSWSLDGLMKLSGKPAVSAEETVSREEIQSIVAQSEEKGVIDENEKDMIESIFRFDEKRAGELLTPRTDVYMIEVNAEPSDYLDELMELQYSRIPVYEGDVDNIIGILHYKDLMNAARRLGFDRVQLRPLLREAYFVPESKYIDELFRELQQNKNHIAIVVDEYGGFAGIVTIEDLIEEIMGDIQDEFDTEQPDIVKTGERTYTVRGLTALDKLDEELELGLTSEHSDSVGGYLVEKFGSLPDDGFVGRTLESDGVRFEVLSVDENRFDLLKLTVPDRSADTETEA